MIDPPVSSTAARESRPAGVSVAEATVAIVKTCIGGGVLALPYAHLQGGVLAVPAMCLFGLWNWITSKQLLLAYEALSDSETRGTLTGWVGGRASPCPCGYRRPTLAAHGRYSAVAYAALGHGGVLLFDTLICMLLTGVCASIQVQAAHLVEPYVQLPSVDVYR